MSPSLARVSRPARCVWVGFSHLVLITIITILLSLHVLEDSPNHTTKKAIAAPPTVNPASRARFMNTWKGSPKNVKPKLFVKSLVSIAQNLHQASIHAKSLKTISALKKATVEIRAVLRQLSLGHENITARDVTAPRTVCPEEYRGAHYGSDRYEKGFETVPCDNGKPLSGLITVLLLLGNSTRSVHGTVTDIQGIIPGVHTVVGLEEPREHGPKSDNALVTQVSYMTETFEGKIWNKLLESVQTEYVLIARDVHIFDKHMRIDRLIRVMETLGFVAAGGASRDSLDGKWKLGCYQSGMRNYTAVYHAGYDESVQECVVCDYTDGPFVIRTKTLREEAFDDTITGNGIFHDLFLRLGQESVAVCPDSMFHVRPTSHVMQATSTSWERFAKKWEIYKLKFVPGPEIIFKCNIKTRQTCAFKANMLSHPCCVADIVMMLNHVVSICESRDVVYEVRSGTLLGAVKVSSILPWDIDVDLNYLLSNYSVVKQLISQFSLPGHKCHVQIAPQYDYNNSLLSASFQLDSTTSFWKVEIWGRAAFAPCIYRTAVSRDDGRTVRTRVNINDVWVHTAFNPGLWARNRYGFEVLRHAQHWRSLGKLTSMEQYPTHAFLECPEPGHHACLDYFNTDGNLQFSADPIP